MWIRYVRYQATTQCCYEGNAMLYRGPLIFPERTLNARFRERPTDDIREWAENIILRNYETIAENACKELADEYYAGQVDAGIIYTSETFVGPEVVKPEVKVPVEVPPEVVVPPEVKVPEEVVPVKIPFDVPLRIERLEELIDEAETDDERIALEDELRKLKPDME